MSCDLVQEDMFIPDDAYYKVDRIIKSRRKVRPLLIAYIAILHNIIAN